MIRRFISKPLHQPLPPAMPRDLQGGRPDVVRVDGTRKQALDTGRTRLLVAAMSFTLAFALIGWRLVDLGLMAEQHEPSLARSLSSGAAGLQRVPATCAIPTAWPSAWPK